MNVRKLAHFLFVKLTLIALLVFLVMTIFASCRQIDPQTELRILRNGDDFPNLVLSDLNGNEFDLDSVEDEIVLVDFWASWCAPCRKAHPELVEVYEKYSASSFKGGTKGFRIVSVSFDDKRKNWLNAIEKDGLPWADQLSDGKAMPDSNIPMRYGFLQIPTSFLLDKDKRIIGKNLSPKALAYDLKLRLLP